MKKFLIVICFCLVVIFIFGGIFFLVFANPWSSLSAKSDVMSCSVTCDDGSVVMASMSKNENYILKQSGDTSVSVYESATHEQLDLVLDVFFVRHQDAYHLIKSIDFGSDAGTIENESFEKLLFYDEQDDGTDFVGFIKSSSVGVVGHAKCNKEELLQILDLIRFN